MSSQAELREKEDRLLVEMTDLSADLARDMATRAKKAEASEDAERYTRIFDRMIRSMRLSIALRRRLERQDARDEAQRRTEAVDLRRARLHARLRGDIRESGASPNQRFELERELDSALAEDVLYERFTDLPLAKAISRLRDRLGLVPPPGRSPIEGEVDRDDSRETEGGETHADFSGPQPPHPTTSGAPPEGEHLGGLSKPVPS